jgi:hypothetical protein
MGKADGLEAALADKAAWDEAMASFGQRRSSSIPKKPNPLAALSLHARRLLPPDDKSRDASD